MLRDDDKQPETAEKAHDPMTKENYFYSDAQKEIIHLAIDYAPMGFKALEAPPWLCKKDVNIQYKSAEQVDT